MPQKFRSLLSPNLRLKLFAVALAALALLIAAAGDAARAQRRRTPQSASNANASAQGQKSERPKRVFVGQGSSTAKEARQTIKSDNPLNDYSAYRSGDRFVVVLPKADASAVARGGAGKGYSEMQVQQRGNDVVLSYKLQPGAKPRVEQKFNRLDVVFDVAEGGQQQPAADNQPGQSARTATPHNTPPAEGRNTNPAGQTSAQTQGQAAATTNPAAVRPSDRQPAASPEGSGQRPSILNASPGSTPQATPADAAPVAEQTPAAAPTAAPQVAQAQPPASAPAPGSAISNDAATGMTLGAALLRNWPVTLIVSLLLVVGLGLLFAARRTSHTARPTPEEELQAAPTPLAEKRAASLRAESASAKPVPVPVPVPVVKPAEEKPSAVAAVTPAVEKVETKEEKKKAKKKARKAEEKAAREAVAAKESAVAEEPVVTEVPAVAEEAVATEAAAAEEVVAEPSSKEIVVAEEPAVEPAAAEAVAEPERVAEVTKEITPSVEFDPERVQLETSRLLEGESYDPSVVGTPDAMARQMIAAELLSALSGRNEARRERARAAFVEHGYFDETARDLRSAEAPAERAAAARSLGLAGDNSATPHLVAALEDDTVEVRRAAVEALGSLRDPAALAPLEAFVEREQKQKNKVNRKAILHAVESCREGRADAAALAAQPPAEQTPPQAETVVEPEPVPESTELAPFVEPEIVETEAPAGVAEIAEETSVEIAPFVETVAEEPAAEAPVEEPVAPAEPRPIVEAQPAFEAEPWSPALEEPAVAEPEVEPAVVAAEEEAETVEVAAPVGVAEEVGEELTATHDAVEPEVFEHVSQSEPAAEVAAPPVSFEDEDEVKPGEWVEFDMSVVEDEAPAANETEPYAPPVEHAAAPEAIEHAPALEEVTDAVAGVSSIEPFVGGPAVTEEATAETVIEQPAGERAEKGVAAHGQVEEAGEVTASAPSASAAEKGIEVFDEFSTVPASIQHRLMSRQAGDRAEAVAELARYDTPDTFQQICAAFDDEAKEVRSAAARSLYELRADRADSFTRALRESSAERRHNIGTAISASGLAGEAISQLTGESREKTYEAFSLLFLMAKAGEVQPLIRAIEGHPSNEVRLAVVKLLALSGQKEILPAFRRLAVRGSLPTEVRSAVMEAIYQISSGQPTTA